jgi:hypothetical protein
LSPSVQAAKPQRPEENIQPLGIVQCDFADRFFERWPDNDPRNHTKRHEPELLLRGEACSKAQIKDALRAVEFALLKLIHLE